MYPRGRSSFSQPKRPFTQQANRQSPILSPIIHPRPTRGPSRKSPRRWPKPTLSSRARTSRTRPHTLRRREIRRWEASEFGRHVTWRHERRHTTRRRTAGSTLHIRRWEGERHAAPAGHVWSYLLLVVRLLRDQGAVQELTRHPNWRWRAVHRKRRRNAAWLHVCQYVAVSCSTSLGGSRE